VTPALLGALWRAETLKLLSRSSARLGLAVAAIASALGVFALWQLSGSQMVVNGATMQSVLADSANAPSALRWGLYVRNFFVVPAFVILLSAQSLAGELQARTLREELLRPVPRWAVLLAKWAAIGTWIGVTLAVAWTIGAVAGMVLLGTGGPWGEVAAGYIACFLCDLGLAAVSLCVAAFVQGVAGTVVGTFLILVLGVFAGWGLVFVAWLAGIDLVRSSAGALLGVLDAVVQIEPWLPPAALRAWTGVSPAVDWVWQSFASLAAITAVAIALAERRLARLDVP
jgi:ABC-type transport system involved in multi-copper enzyme maturation permease subunit